MIQLSTRYVPALAILLAFASVFVATNWRYPRNLEDCSSPHYALDPSGFRSATPIRERRSGNEANRTHQIRGTIDLPGLKAQELRFSVIRTFNPSGLYVRPARAVGRRMEPEHHQLEWLEVGSETLPIHWIYDKTALQVQLAAYAFVYEGRPTSQPFFAQLASASQQLVDGTRPLAMLFVYGTVRRPHLRAAEERIRGWLADAWSSYRSQCHESRGEAVGGARGLASASGSRSPRSDRLAPAAVSGIEVRTQGAAPRTGCVAGVSRGG